MTIFYIIIRYIFGGAAWLPSKAWYVFVLTLPIFNVIVIVTNAVKFHFKFGWGILTHVVLNLIIFQIDILIS